MKTKVLGLLALAFCLGSTVPIVLAQSTERTEQSTDRVDLTYAAEKAVNSVVYIKVTTNVKTEYINYYDPFEDFFNDFF